MASAKEGITRTESGKFDFVLVDYRMPECDGLWFMRNVCLPKLTKALLVSSYLDRKSINKMFTAGVSGYISKPFDEDELMKHLEFHSKGKILRQIKDESSK